MTQQTTTTAQLEHACDVFNEHRPIGSAVTAKLDSGYELKTFTKSKAWLMGGHSLVVLVEDVSGAYALERVSPRRVTKEEAKEIVRRDIQRDGSPYPRRHYAARWGVPQSTVYYWIKEAEAEAETAAAGDAVVSEELAS